MNFSFIFAELIQPICLPTLLDINNVEKSKNKPFVVGWGSINASPQKGNTNIVLFIELNRNKQFLNTV